MNEKIDVIIPVYKPGKEFFTVLERLQKQKYPVNRIILMNTEQKYFDRLVFGTHFYEDNPKVSVYHVSEKEFDHGFTRFLGVLKSEAPYFIMMTQDAVPADSNLTEQLLNSAMQENVAAAYAKQLPKEDCPEEEKFTRQFNYPDESFVKTQRDLKTLGIKTYFCSNVCAIYNRKIYDELGGFIHRAIFNEDMIYAAHSIKAGYKVAYCSGAKVFHSHNYTGKEQFKRNFDLGVSQAEHPEVFKDVPSESEGIKMVRLTADYLRKNGKGRRIPVLLWISACKYAGYCLGKMYRKLPRKVIEKCTMNLNYWKR